MYHSDKCDVICTDNSNTVNADVIEFKEGNRLAVSLGRSIKLNMIWDKKANLYVGNMAGMEFTSSGPRVFHR